MENKTRTWNILQAILKGTLDSLFDAHILFGKTDIVHVKDGVYMIQIILNTGHHIEILVDNIIYRVTYTLIQTKYRYKGNELVSEEIIKLRCLNREAFVEDVLTFV